MYNYKKLIGELLGAVIAVAWISWAILWPGNMVGLVIAISITILLGTISGCLLRATINNKRLIGELLGSAIAVAWITWALLWPRNMVGLVIAISITILLGTISGGLLRGTINNKRLIGELLGAAIAVVWVSWALLWPGNMVGLVVGLTLTIVFGTISGGLLKLSKNNNDSAKL